MANPKHWIAALLCAAAAAGGCGREQTPVDPAPAVGESSPRRGDEIVVAGRFFHTGAPVVLWIDPGGYDAYRVERRFVPLERADWRATLAEAQRNRTEAGSPNRFNMRAAVLTDEEKQLVRGGGWTLELLQEKVDQFVIHYDVTSLAQTTFRVLHDQRNLSVHFMLDLDGTIYQTLDVKERAWHAGDANTRSVGIEIANIGAYSRQEFKPFSEWYAKDEQGRTRITIPPRFRDGGIRDKSIELRPARNEPVVGVIQGATYQMYDLTPQQYDSLIKLTAALCTALPRITVDYPKDHTGRHITREMDAAARAEFQGLIAHYNLTRSKNDPGPAFQWEYVTRKAWLAMTPEARAANLAARGKPVREIPTTQPATRPNPATTRPAATSSPAASSPAASSSAAGSPAAGF